MEVGTYQGNLLVLAVLGKVKTKRYAALTLCDCGNIAKSYYEGKNLLAKSCGCAVLKSQIARGKTNQMWKSREYNIHLGMMQRCHNPNHTSYANYGARGIRVCERWKKFIDFYSDVGDIPDEFCIDRIDNDKGYEPGNIRFVKHKENNRNTRSSRFWIVFGESFESAIDAAKKHNVTITTIHRWCKGRVRNGKFEPPFEGCSSYLKYR